jgi:hypothetical protein
LIRRVDVQRREDVLARSSGRRGAPILRALLAEQDAAASLTRSELEERFLALCDGAGIPRPGVNQRLGLDGASVEVDFLWRESGLIVELESLTLSRGMPALVRPLAMPIINVIARESMTHAIESVRDKLTSEAATPDHVTDRR